MKALEGFTEFELDNGLYVALQETPTDTVHFRLVAKVGWAHEPEGLYGIDHLMEHCIVTGGTRTWGPNKANKLFFSVSDETNATTFLETTQLHSDMEAGELVLFMPLVAEMAFEPIFDSDTVEQERSSVINELGGKYQGPGFRRNRLFHEAMYKNSVFKRGYMSGGDPEDIRKMTRDDLISWHSRAFVPNNMELYIVGGLPVWTEAAVRELFGRCPRGEDFNTEFDTKDDIREQRTIRFESERERIGIQLLSKLPPFINEDSPAISVLVGILGGSSNNRLYTNLRENRRLVYGARSSMAILPGQSHISTYTDVDPGKEEEALGAIFDEMDRLKSEPVSIEELDEIKRKNIYQMAKDNESNSGKINEKRSQREYGDAYMKYIKGLSTTTAAEVMEAARKYLPDRKAGKYIVIFDVPEKR